MKYLGLLYLRMCGLTVIVATLFLLAALLYLAGRSNARDGVRQRDPTPNAEPVQEDIFIDQPEVGELYYAACGKIDEHNRIRQ